MQCGTKYGVTVMTRMVVSLGLMALAVVVFAQAPSDTIRDPRVFPPSSVPFGKGYGEWGMEFNQWFASIPASENPTVDETGEKCGVGQRGPVWFLVGVTNVSGTAVRNCSIPEGTALFCTIVAVLADNVGIVPPLTVRELRNIAKSIIDSATDLLLEVDGVPIRNLDLFRFTSPVYSYTLPQNNLFQALGNTAAVPGTVFPAVDEGFYVILKPLPVGEHTLRIHAELPGFDFTLDITYHLTVVPLTSP